MSSFFLCQSVGEAQVVTDGTVGEGKALDGPDYDIGAELGTEAGDNLFHSFDQFSIGTGESATFSGPGSIDNIIGRVTGGEISAIDGLIASTIPGASLWLFNPTGVVFGANASIDVSGSFHVSTADELRTTDGGKFSAVDPESSGFSVAAPESFGFLSADPAGITIAGSQLSVDEGETLSVVGGDVDIRGAGLATAGGELNVLAANGPADANVVTGDLTGATGGNISISGGSALASIGDGGGTVRIQGGAFVVEEASSITSTNTGSRDGDVGISIDTAIAEVTGGSIVATVSQAEGRGGDVRISSEEIAIRNRGSVSSNVDAAGAGGAIDVSAGELSLVDGLIASQSADASSGDGGDIQVAAGSIEIRQETPGNSAFIGSGTFGAGDAGNINIQGNELVLDGGKLPSATSIQSASVVEGSRSGTIRLVLDGRLELLRGGAILTQGDASASDAPSVEIIAEDILIDDESSEGLLTGIALDVNGVNDSSGSLDIRADDIEIRNGGVITSITSGAADGGDINLTANNLSIVGGEETSSSSRIDAGTVPGAAGNGGTIIIVADTIGISGNGSISGSTLGEGDAGRIDITAKNSLQLQDDSLITSRTDELGGDAGSILIDTGELTILDRSRITSSTLGAGSAGSIDITASTALLDAGNADTFGGITTQANPETSGNAGTITLEIDDLTLRNESAITSSTFGTGNAGTISITSETITIDEAEADGALLTGISTSVNAAGGDAGAISIAADQLVLRGNSALIASSNSGTGEAGIIAIQLSESLTLDEGAGIVTSSISGGGGGIRIDAGSYITATGPDAVIATTVADDTGNAGDILIEAPVLALGDSRILAQADAGVGGDIQVTVDDLILSPDAEINAEAGATGVDGTIAISSPEVDLTSGLVALDGRFLDISALLRERCAARREETSSSFTLGTGGSIPADLDAPRLSLLEAPIKPASADHPGQRTVLVLPCPKAKAAS